MRFDVQRWQAKRVLERRHVVGFQHDHAVGAHGFEQLCDVAQRERVERLGLPVLARVREVGHDSGDARRAMVAQGRHEHQQTAQLVVRALVRSTVQAGDDVHVLATRVHQRAPFVFTVFEATVFVEGERLVQLCSQATGEAALGIKRKDQHGESSSWQLGCSACRHRGPAALSTRKAFRPGSPNEPPKTR